MIYPVDNRRKIVFIFVPREAVCDPFGDRLYYFAGKTSGGNAELFLLTYDSEADDPL